MGALAFDLEVVSVSEPVPSVRRVRLSGPGLEDMDPKPGQDVMLAVTPTSRRRYSVRAYDPAGPWVDLDFVLHGDGPAVTWASRAARVPPSASSGPGGRYSSTKPHSGISSPGMTRSCWPPSPWSSPWRLIAVR